MVRPDKKTRKTYLENRSLLKVITQALKKRKSYTVSLVKKYSVFERGNSPQIILLVKINLKIKL